MADERKNHRIKTNSGRKSSKAKKVWTKRVELVISGTDVDGIKKTASDIYALQNEFTTGGRDGRKVQILRVKSSDVEVAFNGKI